MSLCFNNRSVARTMVLCLLAVPALACGPHFPNRMLIGGDEVVLKAPVANFHKEIERIKPPVPSRFKAVIPSKEQERQYYLEDQRRHSLKGEPRRYSFRDRYLRQTAIADVADLENALRARNLPEEQKHNITHQYRAARKAILEYGAALSKWKCTVSGWKYRKKILDSNDLPRPQFSAPSMPEGLPGEFADYLRGAIGYHQGQTEKAIELWQGLLKRPKGQRLYRSTWAAFMIGKTLVEEKPAESIRWFQRVRQLAEEGYADSLGLASSSLGWEARALLKQERYDQAIELYVAQMATGDRGAIVSLQWAAGGALKASPEVLAQVARNSVARKVVTAYVISRGGAFNWRFSIELTRKWLVAVETAGVCEVQEADRLALAAYQAGEVDLAQRWVDVAPEHSVVTQWILAKLLLRAGKVPEAAEHLARIASQFPPARRPRYGYRKESLEVRARGELGVLRLARRQYTEALDALLCGGYWEDAAYVAERVLMPDELIEYVNLRWPLVKQGDTREKAYGPIYHANDPNWFRIRIRYLLARRLTRIGRWKEARPCYPARWQSRLDEYIQAIRNGNNEQFSNKVRAAAFWKAACIARYEGMELLGTEVEPDWFVYSGGYERTPASLIRGLPGFEKIVPGTADERQRIRRHVTDPEKRFHYRYTAAEHAWRAAELMPDESDETARVLCIAGSWLKERDPDAADRFYKAMVWRCRRTELGKAADELRWFPKMAINKKQLLQETE